MKLLEAAAGATFLSLSMTSAHAQVDLQPRHVDLLESCHKGLVVWMPLPPAPKCGYVQMPQVKFFDGSGRLRFIGSALDAMKWVKSGRPDTPIPADVAVRNAASEALIDHVPTPSTGLGWVAFYVTDECPPCLKQLATFRSEVMPGLDRGTSLSVFEIASDALAGKPGRGKP